MSIFHCHLCDRSRDSDFVVAVEREGELVCEDCADAIHRTLQFTEEERVQAWGIMRRTRDHALQNAPKPEVARPQDGASGPAPGAQYNV